jgi:fermentation-respiration switch protein FrsA (DUF1100 family)
VTVILLATACLTWLLVSLAATGAFAYGLTHPGCPSSPAERPGFEPVSFQTPDGLSLSAWWKPPQNGAAILLVPGLGSGRDGLLAEGEGLARAGFGLLSIDTRSCAGQPATLGAREVEDLRGAVAFLQARPEVHSIGALGFSAGGVTVIRATARIPQIGAVVAMGGFSDFGRFIADQGGSLFSPAWLAHSLLPLMLQAQTGVDLNQVSPLNDIVSISPRPVLLVYGSRELSLPQGQAQYAAARPPKDLWIVPEADHGGYLQMAPAEFDEKMVKFFSLILPPGE